MYLLQAHCRRLATGHLPAAAAASLGGAVPGAEAEETAAGNGSTALPNHGADERPATPAAAAALDKEAAMKLDRAIRNSTLQPSRYVIYSKSIQQYQTQRSLLKIHLQMVLG